MTDRNRPEVWVCVSMSSKRLPRWSAVCIVRLSQSYDIPRLFAKSLCVCVCINWASLSNAKVSCNPRLPKCLVCSPSRVVKQRQKLQPSLWAKSHVLIVRMSLMHDMPSVITWPLPCHKVYGRITKHGGSWVKGFGNVTGAKVGVIW